MQMHFRVGRFEKFQEGNVNVLSTTDVASRGLDTTRAKHIINFDFPLHVADYIHRCGRAGRVGSSNDCYVTNFVSSQREIDLVQKIEHAARTNGLLQDVNANITNIIRKHIMKDIEQERASLLSSV
jgi:ATP-dependent RNA helicase DDX28